VEEHEQLANSNWQLAKPFYRRGREGRNDKGIPNFQLFELVAFIRLAPLAER
jgi:hypothetical protein